jgi:hypothetical protein
LFSHYLPCWLLAICQQYFWISWLFAPNLQSTYKQLLNFSLHYSTSALCCQGTSHKRTSWRHPNPLKNHIFHDNCLTKMLFWRHWGNGIPALYLQSQTVPCGVLFASSQSTHKLPAKWVTCLLVCSLQSTHKLTHVLACLLLKICTQTVCWFSLVAIPFQGVWCSVP